MAARIRLMRMGAKRHPHSKIVVADSHEERDGRFVEQLGYYDPTSTPSLSLKLERVDYWLSVGALPTDAVAHLIDQQRRAEK